MSETEDRGRPVPTAPVVVVAAALLDSDGRLLAARRSAPDRLAGGWELPGGKVEAGETDREALVRELVEELGVTIQVGARVGEVWPMSESYLLHVYRAEIVHGEPRALEDHDAIRWLEPGDWGSVAWLSADLPVIEQLERERRP